MIYVGPSTGTEVYAGILGCGVSLVELDHFVVTCHLRVKFSRDLLHMNAWLCIQLHPSNEVLFNEKYVILTKSRSICVNLSLMRRCLPRISHAGPGLAGGRWHCFQTKLMITK